MTAGDVLTRLRTKGITARASDGALRLRPKSAVTTDDIAAVAAVKEELLQILVEEALTFVAMPLNVFRQHGALLEVRVPWLTVTLWFVPEAGDAAVLERVGIGRGRILTANELTDLLSVPERTTTLVQTLAQVKLQMNGDITGVRCHSPSPVRSFRNALTTRYPRST